MTRAGQFFRTALLVIIALTFAGATAATAQLQLPGAASSPKAEAAKLPDPLTREAIRDVISTLDDKQVRALLVKRLTEQADARAKALAERDNRSLGQIVDGYARDVAKSISETFRIAGNIPTVVAATAATFDKQRGAVSYAWLFAGLLLALAAGFACYWLLKGYCHGLEQRINEAAPTTLWQKLRLISTRLALQLAHIAAFVFAAYLVNIAMNAAGSPDRYTVGAVISAIAWVWLVIAMVRFVVAPNRPALRLCPLDDETAQLMTWRAGVVAVIATVGFGFLTWLLHFGMVFGSSRLGFWVNLAMHLVIIATLWQARHGITAMLAEDRAGRRPARLQFAQAWPMIAIALVTAHWLVVEIIVATGNATAGILPVMMITLALLIMLPVLDHGLRALIVNLAAIDRDEEAPLQAAQRETQIGLIRCGRIILSLLLFVGVLKLWGVNLFALAQQGVGARFAAALIDIALIALIAYAIWELVSIIVQRQIAIEQAAMGIDPDAEVMADGEGGKGETRLGTILPLVQLCIRIAIVVMAALAIISELGVNITPLLAGAGIIGLAIGFGAQTLVKDVISGLFFLIDDAFRKGEYIDIGDVKGTVEKISVRSMQLRHHNGPLNTVPFGEIKHITNFSRDWVVMKLPLRLTYDTDAEKVRKMIKKLGQEMLEDPVLGPQFLQPLKSQGVIQMEDSAMIMRVKFMTRPGDQWVIRRTVFAKIRDLFEANGIKFAHREVTVRLADQTDEAALTDSERKAITAAARSVVEPEMAGAGRSDDR